MFIPVGDTPNPRNFTPWTNWTIITANVAIYLLISLPLSSKGVSLNDPLLQEYVNLIAPSLSSMAELRQLLSQISSYDLFVFAHGYKPGAPELNDLFASLFLHGGFWHLAGNMLFLWIYGDNVEHRLGRVGYLLSYLLSGVVSTLFFGLFAVGSMAPLVGASGAISGVLGLYFLLFPRNQVKVFIALFPIFFNVILLPARWVLGIYLILDNILPFLMNSQSSVAHGAHIGGFLAGLAIAWGGEHFAWHWPWSDQFRQLGRSGHTETVKPEENFDSSPLSVVRTAVAERNPDRAIDALARMDRQEMALLEPRECSILAGWLDESGYTVVATKLLQGCLAKYPGSHDLADAYLALGLMRLKHGQPTAAYQHLLSVFDYNPDPGTAEQAKQALAQIDTYRRSS